MGLRDEVRVWTVRYRAHNGLARRAYLAMPADLGPRHNPAVPLIVSPHGRGLTGLANLRFWSNLPARGRVAVISPEGHGRVLPLHSWGWEGQVRERPRPGGTTPPLPRRAPPCRPGHSSGRLPPHCLPLADRATAPCRTALRTRNEPKPLRSGLSERSPALRQRLLVQALSTSLLEHQRPAERPLSPRRPRLGRRRKPCPQGHRDPHRQPAALITHDQPAPPQRDRAPTRLHERLGLPEALPRTSR